MDLSIALILIQDGITNGAIYALLAIALVLVFAVTRVIYIPQGEFVAWGALTLASMQAGKLPGTVWLLIAMGAISFLLDAWATIRGQQKAQWLRSAGVNLALPIGLWAALNAMPIAQLPLIVQVLLTMALVVPMGPMIYRVAFQPIADAPVLILLIVSVAVHMTFIGLGLLVFGPEGARTTPFSDASFTLAGLNITGQSIFVLVVSIILIAALYAFFERSLYGKALRATALNRTGARLMGISPTMAGKLTFLLAAFIGVTSGVLIAPTITMVYDSGFLIGLKGFVAAIIGGLVSYPVAALGAILVGILEAFSSFWASSYKEVIVFTVIIPVLLWRSLNSHHVEDEE